MVVLLSLHGMMVDFAQIVFMDFSCCCCAFVLCLLYPIVFWSNRSFCSICIFCLFNLRVSHVLLFYPSFLSVRKFDVVVVVAAGSWHIRLLLYNLPRSGLSNVRLVIESFSRSDLTLSMPAHWYLESSLS